MLEVQDKDTPVTSELDDDSGTGSGSESQEEPVEWLATTREKRTTAGNRLTTLIQQEGEDDDLELLFAEDEDDAGFEEAGDDSDVQMDSSDDDEDQGPAATDDLEGEKELQRQAKTESKKKRKANDHLPKNYMKRIKVDPTTIKARSAAPSRPKKKSERASWIPTSEDAPVRASDRGTTKKQKEQLYRQMIDRERRRLKQLENMEKAAKKKEADKPKELTQEDRLAEAARIEKKNAKSLNRWEEAERLREEEQRAKLAALHDRKMEGPYITWWSGRAEWVGGKLKYVGKNAVEEKEKPQAKRKKIEEVLEAQVDSASPASKPKDILALAPKAEEVLPAMTAPVKPKTAGEAAMPDVGPVIQPVAGAVAKPAAPFTSGTAGAVVPVKDVAETAQPNDVEEAMTSTVGSVETKTVEQTTIPIVESASIDLVEAPDPLSDQADLSGSVKGVNLQVDPEGKLSDSTGVEITENINEASPATTQPPKDEDANKKIDGLPEEVSEIDGKNPGSIEISTVPGAQNSPKALETSISPEIREKMAPGSPLKLPTTFPEVVSLTASGDKHPSTPVQNLPSHIQLNGSAIFTGLSAGQSQSSARQTPLPSADISPNASLQKTSSHVVKPQIVPVVFTPSVPESPPTIEHGLRSCIILDNFNENAIAKKDVQMQILFGRTFPKQEKKSKQPPPPVCVITGAPAKYRDPITGLPYATSKAFRELQSLKKGNCVWSSLLQAYVGEKTIARGVPPRFTISAPKPTAPIAAPTLPTASTVPAATAVSATPAAKPVNGSLP